MTPAQQDAALVKRATGLAQAVENLSQEAGYAQLTQRLTRMKNRWRDGQVRIAVTGMQKRGKSSLINALLDRPGLVPVDEDVATNAHISLTRGEVFQAVARFADRPPAVIPFDQLRDYAAMQGDAGKRAGVLGVEVILNHPLLDGVRLFDTPGVDSLTMGHTHATKQVVATCDVLIFAVSGQDQPLLRHELDFLVEASRSVHRIAFVLTKVDNAPRWEDLLQANQERMRMHLDAPTQGERAPADVRRRLLEAPWFPVSARRAEVAAQRLAGGDVERAQRLLDRSGMPALTQFIRQAAQQRELVRLGPLLDSLGVVLGTIERSEQDKLAAATEDDETLQRSLAEARAAAQRMDARFQQRRGEGTKISFLASDVNRLVRQRIEDVRKAYAEEIAGTELNRPKQVQEYVEHLPESMTRSLDALWEELREQVQAVAEQTLNEFVQSMGLDAVDVVLDPSVRAEQTIDSPAVRAAGLDPIGDGIPMVTLTYSLIMIGSHVLLPVVGLVVGPALSAALMWKRGQMRTGTQARADLNAFIVKALGQAREDFSATLSKLVLQKKSEIEGEVDAELHRQRREITVRAQQTEQLKNQDAVTRRRSADQARARLAAVGRLRSQLVTLSADHPVHPPAAQVRG